MAWADRKVAWADRKVAWADRKVSDAASRQDLSDATLGPMAAPSIRRYHAKKKIRCDMP